MAEMDARPGEVRLPFDPATQVDATITFIGRIRSPWSDPATCPKNLRQARERGGGGTLELAPGYEGGLQGLAPGDTIIALYWMDRSRRDLLVQAPRHREGTAGVFALRSPVRPNPIALATVRIEAIDQAAGTVRIDAIDCLDGTPLLDIKPWIATVDRGDAG